MSNGRKIAAIIKVFHDEDLEVDCHAEHDILMFVGADEGVYFNEALITAGAFWSNEYDCWATWCSA